MSLDAVLIEQASMILAHEARLLHQRAFREWLQLFTVDGCYWVPVSPDQSDPFSAPSHIYECRPALDARIERLYDPRFLPQMPASRVSRLRGMPWLLLHEADRMEFAVDFQLIEARQVPDSESELRIFAGQSLYWVLRDASAPVGWRIQRKRVDLINSESAFFGVSILL